MTGMAKIETGIHDSIAFSPTTLLQSPNPVLLENLNSPLFIKRPPTGLEDRCGCKGVFESRQVFRVQVVERYFSTLQVCHGVHKLLKRHIAVARLAGEVSVFIRSVLHVEARSSSAKIDRPKIDLRVKPRNAAVVAGNIVSSLRLVDSDLTLAGQVVEILVAVHA